MLNRVQQTEYRHIGYRRAIKLFRAGESVYRIRPTGENRLVENINEVSRNRLLGIFKR